MAAAVRIGTCSFADDALIKHWYPPKMAPAERLPYYAERFSAVEIDSSYYAVPSRETVQGWADRTPREFTVHIKAFGLMTRHPVKLDQLPPDLRGGMPLDERGRVDRPPPELRAEVFREFHSALTPLRETGKLGGILFQLPPYITWKPASLDYLEWAQEHMGGDRMIVEFRHRSWFTEDAREQVLRFLEARGMSLVVVDAPEVDSAAAPETLVATTSDVAYVRFHGRNAATWHSRGGSAAKRFDYLYAEDELREWVEPLRELSTEAKEAYVYFNNNNQTNGVAQAPAGAELLRGLLEGADVPVG